MHSPFQQDLLMKNPYFRLCSFHLFSWIFRYHVIFIAHLFNPRGVMKKLLLPDRLQPTVSICGPASGKFATQSDMILGSPMIHGKWL